MKRIKFAAQAVLASCTLIVVASLLCSSAVAKDRTKTVRVSREYSELVVSSSINVIWSTTANDLVLTADEAIMDQIVVENYGEKLKIYLKPSFKQRNIGSITAEVPSSALIDEITISGASTFVSETPIAAHKLDVEVSGASKFKSDLNVRGKLEIDCSGASTFRGNVTSDRLSIELSGASSAVVSGTTGDAEIEVSGASSLSAIDKPVKTVNAECEITGASSAKINCTGAVTGYVSGASYLGYGPSASHASVSSLGTSKAKAEF